MKKKNLNHFERLVQSCKAGELPTDLAAWLLDGLTTYQESEGLTHLEEALALRLPGRDLANGFESALIRCMIHELAGLQAPNQSAPERVEDLIRALNNFEAETLPRLQRDRRLLKVMPYRKRLMFELFNLGVKFPRSRKGLIPLLKTTKVRSVPPMAKRRNTHRHNFG